MVPSATSTCLFELVVVRCDNGAAAIEHLTFLAFFIAEVIPHKIKARDYFELLKARQREEDEDSSDD